MIPAKLDLETMVRDLDRMGWLDYKVELACGLPRGWISKVRSGVYQGKPYENAARLVNFWAYEVETYVPEPSAIPQTNPETT